MQNNITKYPIKYNDSHIDDIMKKYKAYKINKNLEGDSEKTNVLLLELLEQLNKLL